MTASRTRTNEKSPTDFWYLDSASSEHFSPFKEQFIDFRQFNEPEEVETSEGHTVYAMGKGDIQITVSTDKTTNRILLKGVVYAPELTTNLISTTTLMDRGFEINMKANPGVRILKNRVTIANTVRVGKLYRLDTINRNTLELKAKATVAKAEDINIWHRRLVHLGEDNIRKLAGLADGIVISEKEDFKTCQSCMMGRQHSSTSHEPIRGSDKPLTLIHADTSGIINPTALDSITNYGTFIVNTTKMTVIVGLERKKANEIFNVFKFYGEED